MSETTAIKRLCDRCHKPGTNLAVYDSRPGRISGDFHPHCYTLAAAEVEFPNQFPGGKDGQAQTQTPRS